MKLHANSKLLFKGINLFLLLIFMQTKLALSQDTINGDVIPIKNLTFKLSTLVLSGELPFMMEYRSSRIIGNVFSIGIPYLNVRFGAQNWVGLGYKIAYGPKFYCHQNVRRKSWWYINPLFFYKQMWLSGRDYNSDKSIFGIIGGGADSYDEYLYRENRRVCGMEILFGWVKTRPHYFREFYLGIGFRYYTSYETITKWLKSEYDHDWNALETLPKTSKYVVGFSPSIHLGWNLSYPLINKKRNDK